MQLTSLRAAAVMSLLCGLAVVGAHADDKAKQSSPPTAKEIGHEVGTAVHEAGHEIKKAGTEVGHAVRDAARETGHALRDGAKETKKAIKGEKTSAEKK